MQVKKSTNIWNVRVFFIFVYQKENLCILCSKCICILVRTFNFKIILTNNQFFHLLKYHYWFKDDHTDTNDHCGSNNTSTQFYSPVLLCLYYYFLKHPKKIVFPVLHIRRLEVNTVFWQQVKRWTAWKINNSSWIHKWCETIGKNRCSWFWRERQVNPGVTRTNCEN